MAISGSIDRLALGGRSFSVSSENDAGIMLGGFSNEVRANGDATTRTVKTRVTWKITGVEVAISFIDGDLEFLQSLANGPDFAVAMTLADGSTVNGTGQITGDLSGSTQGGTASLELAGQGELTQ